MSQTQTITQDMPLGDIVTNYPQAIEVIQSFGLGCVGCGVSYSESIAQSAKTHGFDDAKILELVQKINQTILENPLPKYEAGSDAPLISLSQKAADKILELMKKQGKGNIGLRFAALPGGCSGFSYSMTFEEKQSEQDLVFETSGVKFFIDPASKNMLSGVTIDYVDALQGSGFKIINPNAKATCGCGQSFS